MLSTVSRMKLVLTYLVYTKSVHMSEYNNMSFKLCSVCNSTRPLIHSKNLIGKT